MQQGLAGVPCVKYRKPKRLMPGERSLFRPCKTTCKTSSKTSSKAVAGFFEDIPALLIVTIGISVFIVSALYIFNLYIEYHRGPDIVEDREAFIHTLRTYEGLQYDKTKQDGMFDPNKIKVIMGENITRDLHPNFRFYIEIYDVSDSFEPVNRTRRPGEGGAINNSELPQSPLIEIAAGYTAVNIMMPLGDVHAARMEVWIWY